MVRQINVRAGQELVPCSTPETYNHIGLAECNGYPVLLLGAPSKGGEILGHFDGTTECRVFGSTMGLRSDNFSPLKAKDVPFTPRVAWFLNRYVSGFKDATAVTPDELPIHVLNWIIAHETSPNGSKYESLQNLLTAEQMKLINSFNPLLPPPKGDGK